ncbi:hypothetical protein CapIbe_012578 [Capra ibex]
MLSPVGWGPGERKRTVWTTKHYSAKEAGNAQFLVEDRRATPPQDKSAYRKDGPWGELAPPPCSPRLSAVGRFAPPLCSGCLASDCRSPTY